MSVPGTPHWRLPSRGRPGSLFLITQVKGLIYKTLCQLEFFYFLSCARAIQSLYSLSMLLLLITYDRESRLPVAFTTEDFDTPQYSQNEEVTVDDGSSFNELNESSGF